ncbi:hypothetical protein CHM34_08400 [Paludifilum halophilum]|uniref:Uncharacterized protein n=1 Tax=Paludifilum halophilum TaxID=1642702 RepID=A0A235B740_9BACL|nr:hypothetical protein CHM34_08400 [Paludifilum halophilum]
MGGVTGAIGKTFHRLKNRIAKRFSGGKRKRSAARSLITSIKRVTEVILTFLRVIAFFMGKGP